MKLDGWGIQKNATASIPKKRRIEFPQSPKSNNEAHKRESTGSNLDGMRRTVSPSPAESPTGATASHDNDTISISDAHLKSSLQEHPFTQPSGRLKAEELVKCLPWHVREHRLLIALLLNWQADGTYLKIALQKMNKTDPIWLWSKSVFEGNIFRIIEQKLESHERGRLTKSSCPICFKNCQHKMSFGSGGNGRSC